MTQGTLGARAPGDPLGEDLGGHEVHEALGVEVRPVHGHRVLDRGQHGAQGHRGGQGHRGHGDLVGQGGQHDCGGDDQ